MNGHRSPLGDGVNGNIPADYLAACRTCEPTGRLTRHSPSSPPTAPAAPRPFVEPSSMRPMKPLAARCAGTPSVCVTIPTTSPRDAELKKSKR